VFIAAPVSGDLPGYPDAAWAAARREVAARAINGLMQRDHAARAQLIAAGGVASVLALLDSEVGHGVRPCRHGRRPHLGRRGVLRAFLPHQALNWPQTRPPASRATADLNPSLFLPQPTPGSERVQFYMASLLATLVLDQEAMSALQARGDGPPMFRTTLRQLARTLQRLKAGHAPEGAAAEASEGGGKGADAARDYRGARGWELDARSQPSTDTLCRACDSARHEAFCAVIGGSPGPRLKAASGRQQSPFFCVGRPLHCHACRTKPLSPRHSAPTPRRVDARPSSCAAAPRPNPPAALAARAEAEPAAEAAGLTPAEVEAAVTLADACAQGMWGSAHYCMCEPLEVTQVRRPCGPNPPTPPLMPHPRARRPRLLPGPRSPDWSTQKEPDNVGHKAPAGELNPIPPQPPARRRAAPLPRCPPAESTLIAPQRRLAADSP
jgi:hypothetical protein